VPYGHVLRRNGGRQSGCGYIMIVLYTMHTILSITKVLTIITKVLSFKITRNYIYSRL